MTFPNPADPNSILVRHKKFLKQLGLQQVQSKQDSMDAMVAAESKTKAFKEAAARQREKIKGLKTTDNQDQNAYTMPNGANDEEEAIEALA